MDAERQPTVAQRASVWLTLIAAALLDSVPLPNPSPFWPSPSLTLCALYFWSLHRQNPLGLGHVLPPCMLLDALSGTPLGLTSASVLVVAALGLSQRSVLQAFDFPARWACFAGAAFAALGLKWLLASLALGHRLPAEAWLWEALLTALAYPLVARALTNTWRTSGRRRRAARA